MKTVLCLLLLFSFSSFAEEGFFAERSKVSDVAKPVWDNSYGIWNSRGGSRGSGVLVYKSKDERTGQYFGFFLTNAHVIEPNCGYRTGWCQGLFISTEMGYDHEKFNYIPSSKEIRFDNLEVVDINQQLELALIRTKISSEQYNTNILKPVRLDPSCQQKVNSEVILIGWPGTYLRPKAPGVQYGRPLHDIKRVSKGFMVSFGTSVILKSYGLTHKVNTSTADALKGNSGGAAVDPDTGFLVGILVGSQEHEKNLNGYTGKENTNPKQYHSVIVPCEDVKAFLTKHKAVWTRDY